MLGGLSADFSVANQTKTSFYGNIYEFSIDYVPFSSTKTIHDIHRYLMKKNGIV